MMVNVEPMAVIVDRTEAYHGEDPAELTPDGPRLLTPPQQQLLRMRA